MSNLNVVALTGRLTADPELRHTSNEIVVTTFRIAVDRPKYKGKEQETDFIDVTAWRQTAEFICKYFSKGSMIAVNGSLRVDNYTDRDGNKRTRYGVQADNVSFCESSKKSSGTTNQKAETVSGNAKPGDKYSSSDKGDYKDLPDSDDLPF